LIEVNPNLEEIIFNEELSDEEKFNQVEAVSIDN
jgi:hypothetical protein